MVALAVAVAALSLSLLAAPPADAQLPVGQAEGVRIVRPQGRIVVVFSERAAKLYRQVAGRRVSVLCTEVTSSGYSTGGETLRAPKRGRRLVTGDLTRGLDYCRVQLTGRSRRVVVSIPLTQRGAVLLDEERVTHELLALGVLANIASERLRLDGPPTTAQLLRFLERRDRRQRARVAGLESPADTPPVGKLGYYSDGGERTAWVGLSASGRRLFIESEPDGVLRTNVATHIYGVPP